MTYFSMWDKKNLLSRGVKTGSSILATRSQKTQCFCHQPSFSLSSIKYLNSSTALIPSWKITRKKIKIFHPCFSSQCNSFFGWGLVGSLALYTFFQIITPHKRIILYQQKQKLNKFDSLVLLRIFKTCKSGRNRLFVRDNKLGL